MRYLVGTITLGLAGAFGSLGLFLLRRSYRKATQWKVAYGGVVGTKTETDTGANSRTSFFPVVEFYCPDGRRYTFRGATGSGRCPAVGGKVKLVYNPEEPTEADLFWDLWFGPAVSLIFGVFFLLFALLTYAGFTSGS
ncbi:MAG TPA: DUF3592 domain-containing protein [Bacillota bacterium]|nr:DUF3592 domain-containing protein [Bacillota bacterium]